MIWHIFPKLVFKTLTFRELYQQLFIGGGRMRMGFEAFNYSEYFL